MNLFLVVLMILYVIRVITVSYCLGANEYPASQLITTAQAVFKLLISIGMLVWAALIFTGVIQ